jgi:predicted dithiol-disulfide oxidoreductase (DUF899 family)
MPERGYWPRRSSLPINATRSAQSVGKEGCKSCSFLADHTPDEMAKGKAYYNYEMSNSTSEELFGTYNYLDLVPKGRDEAGLPFTMPWVRHHDTYGD